MKCYWYEACGGHYNGSQITFAGAGVVEAPVLIRMCDECWGGMYDILRPMLGDWVGDDTVFANVTPEERIEAVINAMSDDERVDLIAAMLAGDFNEPLPERADRLEREYGEARR